MPKIQFGASAYVENSYGLPSAILENQFAEAAEDRPDWDYRLVPTPGLVSFSTGGSEGRGCFQSDAIASGEVIVAYGTGIRRIGSAGAETAITGPVTNDTKPIAFGLSQTQAVINSGGDVYTVTASAVTDFTANLVSAGASGEIIDVSVVNNRHLFVEDNSARVFYSDPGDAATIDGFFTAERDPDQARAILVVASNVLVLGTKKTEFWTPTDSATVPFIQRQGFVLEYGIIGSRARTQIGGAGYWVAHDNTVRAWRGGVAERISSHWLERQIESLSPANKALVRMTAHNWIGHQFVKLYLPGLGSYFYDALTGKWHRRKDIGDEVTDWGYDYFVDAFGETFVQKLSNGKLLRLDRSVFVEDSATVRRASSSIVAVSKPERINTLIVEGQAGVGLDITSGQGFDPQCMLRVSYDGRVFRDEMIREIGKYGEWRWRPVFGPLGTLMPPVAVVELAYSDPVGWSVYGVSVNERAY